MGQGESNQMTMPLIEDILKDSGESTAASDTEIFRIHRGDMPLVFPV